MVEFKKNHIQAKVAEAALTKEPETITVLAQTERMLKIIQRSQKVDTKVGQAYPAVIEASFVDRLSAQAGQLLDSIRKPDRHHQPTTLQTHIERELDRVKAQERAVDDTEHIQAKRETGSGVEHP